MTARPARSTRRRSARRSADGSGDGRERLDYRERYQGFTVKHFRRASGDGSLASAGATPGCKLHLLYGLGRGRRGRKQPRAAALDGHDAAQHGHDRCRGHAAPASESGLRRRRDGLCWGIYGGARREQRTTAIPGAARAVWPGRAASIARLVNIDAGGRITATIAQSRRRDRPRPSDPGREGRVKANRASTLHRARTRPRLSASRSERDVPDAAGSVAEGTEARSASRDVEAANAFLRDRYLPEHNARFAVEPAGAGSAFTPIPGVDLDDDPVRRGGARRSSQRQLRLLPDAQPPRCAGKADAAPFRARAGQGARLSRRARTPSSTGPSCIGRYDEQGRLRTTDDARRAA